MSYERQTFEEFTKSCALRATRGRPGAFFVTEPSGDTIGLITREGVTNDFEAFSEGKRLGNAKTKTAAKTLVCAHVWGRWASLDSYF